MKKLMVALVVLSFLALPVFAQDDHLENFRVEVTGIGWRIDPTATITTTGGLFDIQTDLGIGTRKDLFRGRFVGQFNPRHRVFVEITPYRLKGVANVTRTLTFGSQTYRINDQIASSVELNQVAFGYQYNFVSTPQGHVGLLGSVVSMKAKSSVASTTTGARGLSEVSVPIPLVGVEGRGFPIPGSSLVSLGGEIKGMSFGSYGRYVDGNAHIGIGIFRNLTVGVAYTVLDADIHTSDKRNGAKPNFKGPTLFIQFRDR